MHVEFYYVVLQELDIADCQSEIGNRKALYTELLMFYNV